MFRVRTDTRATSGAEGRARAGLFEYLPMVLALAGGLGLTAVLTLSMSSHARDVAQYDFSEEAKGAVAAIDRELRANIDLVRWLGALMTASPDISESEFNALAASVAGAESPLRLMWAPLIHEHAGEACGVEAPCWSAPVKFGHNAPAAGPPVDLAADIETRQYLGRAAQSGRMFFPSNTATARELAGSGTVLVICPVYLKGRSAGPNFANDALGFTIGLVSLRRLANAAFAKEIPIEVDLHLFDFFRGAGDQFLHFRPGASRQNSEAYIDDPQPFKLGAPNYIGAINLGETRRWLIACTPAPAYEIGIQSWSPYLGLVLGLAFTAVMAWHFQAAVRQRRAAEALVLRRTAALRRTNDRLLHEAAARERFELERDGLLSLLEESNASLQQVNAQLERSNKDLQDFALVASHDLKEPLRKVRVLAQSLRDRLGPRLDPDAAEYMELMDGVLGRMHALITNLLRVSRVTTHGQPFEAVDMRRVIDEVISDLAVRIKETGGEIEVGEVPTVLADPLQMRQFVQNILDNSLKYHREGVPPRIIVASAPDLATRADGSDACAITFRDNGIGFAPELAERAFTLFQRLNNGARVEGSGVGLAVCRKIAERHGGTLRVESETGRGSTFTITLPVARNGHGAEAQEEIQPRCPT